MKLTKQGVRDLGYSKKPKMIELPPEAFECKHEKKITLENGDTSCTQCNMIWDWNSRSY